MKQEFTTADNGTVSAIFANESLTLIHARRSLAFRVPPSLLGEVSCAMRRTDWPRMFAIAEVLNIYKEGGAA